MQKVAMKLGAGTRQTSKITLSFIGPDVPFVGQNNPRIRPFIGKNRPFICIGRNSGFTLVELIITLVIAAILLAVAAPSMTSFILRDRLTTQANELVADLSYARSEAIKRGAPVTVCKTADPSLNPPQCITGNDGAPWTTGRIVFVDIGGIANQVDGGTDVVLRVREALDGTGNGLYGDGNNGGTGNRIIFTGLGVANPPGASTQFVFCDNRGPGEGVAVAIRPTGRTRVTAKGYAWDNSNLTATDCS
ncbi:MAG: GspH/FimT family pseudopilin [Acidiferrobacterales bacterium]